MPNEILEDAVRQMISRKTGHVVIWYEIDSAICSHENVILKISYRHPDSERASNCTLKLEW